MQPYFFPYIGYFQFINSVDVFLIYDDVNYINKGWINRNYILINNQTNLFSVPLIKASQNKLINEIQIDYSTNWKEKFIRKIETAYRKAPYFHNTMELITLVLDDKYRYICDLALASIKSVSKFLEINTKIIDSSRGLENKYLKGQDRIIDICKKMNAKQYINPLGGIDLYDKESFDREKIKLHFVKAESTAYCQFANSFVSNLSIIDVMMFNSQEQIKVMCSKYEIL
jgi:hypothetical protein